MEKIIIRVDKKHAAFVYWTIESMEGYAFHSTITEKTDENGKPFHYRDIEVFVSPDFSSDIQEVFSTLEEAGIKITIIDGREEK